MNCMRLASISGPHYRKNLKRKWRIFFKQPLLTNLFAMLKIPIGLILFKTLETLLDKHITKFILLLFIFSLAKNAICNLLVHKEGLWGELSTYERFSCYKAIILAKISNKFQIFSHNKLQLLKKIPLTKNIYTYMFSK